MRAHHFVKSVLPEDEIMWEKTICSRCGLSWGTMSRSHCPRCCLDPTHNLTRAEAMKQAKRVSNKYFREHRKYGYELLNCREVRISFLKQNLVGKEKPPSCNSCGQRIKKSA